MEIGNATARLNSQASVSSDFASTSDTFVIIDPAQTEMASQTPWVTLVEDDIENSPALELSANTDAESTCEQTSAEIAYTQTIQLPSLQYTAPSIPDQLLAKLTTLCAEQAQELGYYQGLVAAKQEQLKQVPELRRQAARGIIAERQLAAARQQIATLESEVSVLKTKPLNRIVNALLTGNDLAPSVQKILLLLILTSSSVITIMLLTGV